MMQRDGWSGNDPHHVFHSWCHVKRVVAAFSLVLLLSAMPVAAAKHPRAAEQTMPYALPRTGFTIHFDFLNSAKDAERLVLFAAGHGAQILNVVPPPHIWEDSASLKMLRRIFALAQSHGIDIVLTRIDASAPSPQQDLRFNYLYTNILTARGQLPEGRRTPDYFLATVGNGRYEKWLREETRYYAEQFSGEPNLAGFSLGLFNEPFVSQRGSLLCYDDSTFSYEIAQYTPFALRWWHKWLRKTYSGGIDSINRSYETSFAAIDSVPTPHSEEDERFENARAAYWDFVSCINDWVVTQYEECRTIWHEKRKAPVPFILQFSGYVMEKFEKGRPAFAALDIFDWMRRADALGLSLYTNGEYPDWGHASVTATVNALRLGSLLRKPVFVLEGGNEFNGAVMNARELRFFADAARTLRPRSVIYEFLKMSYDEHFRHHRGKIVSRDWKVDDETLRAVMNALEEAKMPVGETKPVYVLDDPGGNKDSDSALLSRKQLVHTAMETTLVFVPAKALPSIPASSTCVVLRKEEIPQVEKALSGKNVTVLTADELLQNLQSRQDAPAAHATHRRAAEDGK